MQAQGPESSQKSCVCKVLPKRQGNGKGFTEKLHILWQTSHFLFYL